jgi:glutathione S-transferase
MANVEIIGFPASTYTRVVRMVCEEKAIPYDLRQAPPHSPDVTAIHPFGKIPVMRHGDFELCESKAIATYLDLSFPGPKLIPTEPRQAALTEQWVSLVNTRMDGTMVRTYLFAYIFPKTGDGAPDRKAIEAVTPALKEEGRQGRLPCRRQLYLRRHQFDADPVLSAEFSRGCRRHSGGEGSLVLLSAPGRATELSEHDTAAATGAAGQGVLTDCIPAAPR